MYAIVLPEDCVDHLNLTAREYEHRPRAARDAFLAIHFELSLKSPLYVRDLANLYDIADQCVAWIEHV
jgi:hypothetical protein